MFRKKSKKQIWILLPAAFFLSVNWQNSCRAEVPAGLLEKIQGEISTSKLSEQTLNQIQALVQKNEKDADAHLYLGLMLERMGLREEAFAQYKLAVQYGPQNPDALIELVKREIKQGHIPSAIQLLRDGLKKFPNNPEMLLIVGDYLIQQEKMDEAREVLETAFEVNPDILGLPTSLAQIYLSGHPGRSIKLTTQDLNKDPKFERALRVRGVAYFILGDYRKAISDLKPVFDRNPNVPAIAESLFDSYMSIKNYDAALRPGIFMVAFSAMPDVNNTRLINKLVTVIKKLPVEKVQSESISVSEEIDNKFKISAFHVQLGQALDRAGMNKSAIAQYEKAVAIDPKNVEAHYQLGLDYELILQNWQRALECYRTAHSLRSWDEKIYMSYLRLLDRMHNRNNDLAQKYKSALRGF